MSQKIGNKGDSKTTYLGLTDELWCPSSGVFETAVEGHIYISPDQHGGIYGTIYRRYHGSITTGDTIPAVGITKLISYGGRFRDNDCYSNFTSSGTHYIALYGVSGSDEVTVEAGWTVNEGWIEYSTT